MQANTIILPVDFSTDNDKSLELATSLARDSGAKLFIVHAREPLGMYSAGSKYYGVPQPRAEDLAEMLEAVVPPAQDIPYEHRMLEGTAADAIVDFAEQTRADLIVMGTHGRTGLFRVLLGSVAEAVVRKASCPVATVKQTKAEPEEKQAKDEREESESLA
jgi:nucleotide-binding universal stress UspA family protein